MDILGSVMRVLLVEDRRVEESFICISDITTMLGMWMESEILESLGLFNMRC